ncbi:D-amino-acid oxidase [Seminavis robusta]|uniref:D-amino-acid oxidase n=1 Tax=Seminavis robusta TaxID=568900 RepID=A0A9N8HGR1_9STRA|nr:D-amino-acid oxidase [Seminavis robusta]|eukprot:Sro652_g181890.1 D-amino-acid oxidase (377) ;mRNA; f:48745-50068
MRALVVGSGAIGLRTAVELIRRKVPVTLRSPVSPLHPSVCSIGAGGLWMPFHCDDSRTDRWASETLDELWSLGKEEDNDLVEIMPAVSLENNNNELVRQTEDTNSTYTDTDKLPTWTKDPRLEFQQLTVEMLGWQNIVKKLRIPTEEELKRAGYWHAWMFQTPIVDSPKMLQALLKEIEENPDADVDVETGEYYESVDHMQEVAQSLSCDTVINCAGMGSHAMCQDKNLVGGRGVLLQVERNNCPRRPSLQGMEQDAVLLTEARPWGSDTEPCYMIPRGNIIAIGGTYLEGDTHPQLRDSERKRLMENAQLMGIDIANANILGEWTGFRPYRPIVRCEEEETQGHVRVIHSYGHGGSGWTVNVGAAKEVADILLRT